MYSRVSDRPRPIRNHCISTSSLPTVRQTHPQRRRQPHLRRRTCTDQCLVTSHRRPSGNEVVSSTLLHRAHKPVVICWPGNEVIIYLSLCVRTTRALCLSASLVASPRRCVLTAVTSRRRRRRRRHLRAHEQCDQLVASRRERSSGRVSE